MLLIEPDRGEDREERKARESHVISFLFFSLFSSTIGVAETGREGGGKMLQAEIGG